MARAAPTVPRADFALRASTAATGARSKICSGKSNTVHFFLTVRRFFCDIVVCPRKIFAEVVDTVPRRYRRKTTCLDEEQRTELNYWLREVSGNLRYARSDQKAGMEAGMDRGNRPGPCLVVTSLDA